MPLLSIIMGGMGQAFVDATTLKDDPMYLGFSFLSNFAIIIYLLVNESDHQVPFNETYSWDTFSSDMQDQILYSVYLGAGRFSSKTLWMIWILGLFVSAFIQVTCFLIASENLMHRMRKEFFKAILRQDIAWYDANHSGTLTSKLFDNLERIKEGTGDKVALAVQFLAQFFGGFIVGKLSLSRYPVMYDEISLLQHSFMTGN